MAIPLATTTITVLRPAVLDADSDPYDEAEAEPDEVASGVRANIAIAAGREEIAGRSEVDVVTFRLRCDPVDVSGGDVIVDDTTGETYAVIWSRDRVTGLGLDHVVADLRLVVVPAESASS